MAAVPVLPPRAAGRKGGAAASRWQADHLIDGRQAAHQVFWKKSFIIYTSVADPNPGSGAFLTPGSGIRDG